jgi:hypothetical protein
MREPLGSRSPSGGSSTSPARQTSMVSSATKSSSPIRTASSYQGSTSVRIRSTSPSSRYTSPRDHRDERLVVQRLAIGDVVARLVQRPPDTVGIAAPRAQQAEGYQRLDPAGLPVFRT